ncbi:DsbA family protein [Clostridium sp. MB05]
MKKKIYYIMDTMCGWCYGFSNVITEIQEKYNDKYDFVILPGGMWIDENVKVINDDLGNYIKSHNINIERLTGRKFGEGFNKNVLGNKNIVLDSLPGAKALVLAQKLKKDTAFDFLKKLQEAFFVDGKDPNNLETYTTIAEESGIDKDEFEKKFLSEELINETYSVFNMVASMGAMSFPTVIMVEGNKGTIIAQGYSSFEELDKILSI